MSRASRQEGPQAQDFRIPVLLDAVLCALCVLGVRRAVHHAKRDKGPETQRYSVWSRSCGASVALIAGGLDSVVTAPIIRT